jgi:hypothetical protein
MTLTIALTPEMINTLDIAPAVAVIEPLRSEGATQVQIKFAIEYPLELGDPRELPEVPEVRLWFIHLDAMYPWLPLWLDWPAGELARYTAMLVPHQFHAKDGLIYNPEALEIFVMHKTFVSLHWCRQQGIEGKSQIKAMTQMLGYELDDGFFDLLSAKS